jgi:hypothetical protein
VDSCLDALIHKKRITIQIQPSGRQSAWPGRALNRYENCVLKINQPDDHPPWSRREKSYMEITCSGRATVRTTVHHCPDAALKQGRFSTKISKIMSHSCPSGQLRSNVRTASILITVVSHLNHRPINRGPWALRTARIRY